MDDEMLAYSEDMEMDVENIDDEEVDMLEEIGEDDLYNEDEESDEFMDGGEYGEE